MCVCLNKSIIKKKKKRSRRRLRPCEDKGRDGGDAASAKECLVSPEAREAKKESSLKLLEAAWPCPQLDIRLLPSGTMREYISIVFSHHVCDYLLHNNKSFIYTVNLRVAFSF